MAGFVNGLKKVNGVYHAKFQVSRKVNGETVTKTIHRSTRVRTLEAAKAILRKWQDEAGLKRAGIDPMTVGSSSPTLQEVHQKWLKDKKGLVGKDWYRQVEQSVPTHQEALLFLPVDQIDAPAVRGMVRHYLSTKGRAYRPEQGEWEMEHTEGGANTQVKILLTLLNYAVEQEWLTAIRFKRKQVTMKAQEHPEPVVWPEQVPAFLAAVGMSKDIDAMIAIGFELGLGLREGEALGVRIEWIDRTSRRYIPGKTKNRRTREVPIPDWLWDLIEPRLKELGTRNGLLIPGLDGKGRRRGYTQKPVARSGEAIGIHGLHPHCLRYTFATTHFENDTPLTQIQQMMGHADPTTTMGYIRQRPKGQAAAQKKVAQAQRLQGPKSVAICWQPRQPRKKKAASDKAAS